MKKILLFGAVAAMMAAATSCGSSSSTSDFTNPKGLNDFTDSLAYYSATIEGLNMSANIGRMLPEDVMANFSKDQFLKGMKAVLDVDTADQSYIYGMYYAFQVKQQLMQQNAMGVAVSSDNFYNAFANAFRTDSVADTIKTQLFGVGQELMGRAQTIMLAKQQELEAARVKAMEEKAMTNDAAGKEYIAKIKKEDSEVKTTESGLSYKVITMGKGPVAAKGSNQSVPVKYVGKHIDGTVFDSSNGEIVNFPVNGVVAGFSEALTTFPAGSKVILYMPADIAYGAQGNQAIEPGETLVFELEICEPEAPAAADTTATAPQN